MNHRDTERLTHLDARAGHGPLASLVPAALKQEGLLVVVATYDSATTGLLAYRPRRGYLEVVRVAVLPERQRQGVGAALLRRVFGFLKGMDRDRLVANVPDDNLAAQLWLKACGFVALRVNRGGPDGPDTYRMVKRS